MPYLVLTLLGGAKHAVKYSEIESVTEAIPKHPAKKAKGCCISTGGDPLQVQEEFEAVLEAINRCENSMQENCIEKTTGVAANEQ